MIEEGVIESAAHLPLDYQPFVNEDDDDSKPSAKEDSSGASSSAEQVVPIRSAQEIARDTKRILEICYGSPEGEEKRKKKKKKKSTKTRTGESKREKTDGEREKKKVTRKKEKAADSDNNASNDRVDRERKKIAKKRGKDVGSHNDTNVDRLDEDNETENIRDVQNEGENYPNRSAASSKNSGRRKKRRRKKRQKPTGDNHGNSFVITRDAAGRVIRRHRKIKGRDRVVRKENMKKGKDAKMDLPVISEYSSGEYIDDDNSSDSKDDGSQNDFDDDIDSGRENFEIDGNFDGEEQMQDDCDEPLGPCTAGESRSNEFIDDSILVEGQRSEYELDAFGIEDASSTVDSITISRPVPLDEVVSNENVRMRVVDVTPTTADITIDLEANHNSSRSMDSTACTSTAPERSRRRRKPIPFFGSVRNLIAASGLFVFVMAGLGFLAVYLISIGRDDPIEATIAPSSNPTDPQSFVTPTSPPTNVLDTISTSCQRPIKIPGEHLIQEAEYAPLFYGNASIGINGEGFCGDGYVTNLTEAGSGISFLPFEIFETGYYRVAVRYNNIADTEKYMLLQIDDHEKGVFDLIPTGNESTWMIQGVDEILLRKGRHDVGIFIPADSEFGPNVDWISLSLQKRASRFEYLVHILGLGASVQTDSQREALEWMSNHDPLNWITLTNEEIKERYSLVELFYASAGDEWANNNQWLSEYHVCSWYGIACSQEKLVTDILLDKNNLSGPIPENLFLLTNLIFISLDTNSLRGTLPHEIGKLENLSQLFLHANFMTGSLPSELGSLENLNVIDLRANNFESRIPEEMYSMIGLESLALASNVLGGNLSTNIGKLTNLKHLDLQSDKLIGDLPKELGKLTLLTSLSLGYNEFTGSVPSELGLLTNLSVLDINSNQLTGILPVEVSMLNDTIVDYYGNDIIEL